MCFLKGYWNNGIFTTFGKAKLCQKCLKRSKSIRNDFACLEMMFRMSGNFLYPFRENPKLYILRKCHFNNINFYILFKYVTFSLLLVLESVVT